MCFVGKMTKSRLYGILSIAAAVWAVYWAARWWQDSIKIGDMVLAGNSDSHFMPGLQDDRFVSGLFAVALLAVGGVLLLLRRKAISP